jgi:hypothetical protein
MRSSRAMRLMKKREEVDDRAEGFVWGRMDEIWDISWGL